jgi:hypothetical protein
MQSNLTTLGLWRVGLETDFDRLLVLMPSCSALTTLILDNNNLQQVAVSQVSHSAHPINGRIVKKQQSRLTLQKQQK